MAEIIGVRFKRGGKIYYFQPNDEELNVGSFVIVETIRGTECGEVVLGRREISDDELNHELKTIIRKATKEDLEHVEENKRKAKKAFDICNEKIKAHGLEMNLLEVEYTFDNSKILFSFSAEGRVDFRELVKDLASIFRARIELRQIGVRDEAKMLGGIGVCGRPFCCKQFMGEFQSVSIKMAKEQGLSLNPVKISGTCGRLMCCLKHEQDAYEDLIRFTPPIGSTVITPDGKGVVTDQELIAGKVKVRLNSTIESPPKTYKVTEIKRCNNCQNETANEEISVDDVLLSNFDTPESAKELEMLSELEKMENYEGNAPNPPCKQKVGKNNFKRGKSGANAWEGSQKNRPQGERKNNNNRSNNKADSSYHKHRTENEFNHVGKSNNSRGKYRGKQHSGKKRNVDYNRNNEKYE